MQKYKLSKEGYNLTSPFDYVVFISEKVISNLRYYYTIIKRSSQFIMVTF